MGFLEKVYENSPIFFQNIMVSASGYQRNKSRYGKAYYEYRNFLRDFDTWSFDKKLEYQNKILIDFIHYATDKSLFYKHLYAGIDLSAIKTTQDLKCLPIVDKEMLRNNIEDVLTIPKKGALINKTGGTTGKSLTVYNTVVDTMKRNAMLDHFKSRMGFEHRKMKRATFNSQYIVPPKQAKKIFWRYNSACKQMIYSPYRLTEENLIYYVNSLNKFKPQAIDGFLMPIYDIAGFIDRNSLKLDFTPMAIFPTSETLTLPIKKLIERAFNCKVYNQYASAEGAPFITECKNQFLHIEMASGVFEPFEEGSNEILVTSFTTHGTPLIRYRIGDEIEFTNKNTCNCGNVSIIVNEIQGRESDFLYTSSGAKIRSVTIANMTKNIPNAVRRIQVQQDKIGEIIVLLEVDSAKYKKEYDDVLRNDFMHRFGAETSVVFKHIDEIPREPNGKYRLVKNNIYCGVSFEDVF